MSVFGTFLTQGFSAYHERKNREHEVDLAIAQLYGDQVTKLLELDHESEQLHARRVSEHRQLFEKAALDLDAQIAKTQNQVLFDNYAFKAGPGKLFEALTADQRGTDDLLAGASPVVVLSCLKKAEKSRWAGLPEQVRGDLSGLRNRRHGNRRLVSDVRITDRPVRWVDSDLWAYDLRLVPSIFIEFEAANDRLTIYVGSGNLVGKDAADVGFHEHLPDRSDITIEHAAAAAVVLVVAALDCYHLSRFIGYDEQLGEALANAQAAGLEAHLGHETSVLDKAELADPAYHFLWRAQRQLDGAQPDAVERATTEIERSLKVLAPHVQDLQLSNSALAEASQSQGYHLRYREKLADLVSAISLPLEVPSLSEPRSLSSPKASTATRTKPTGSRVTYDSTKSIGEPRSDRR